MESETDRFNRLKKEFEKNSEIINKDDYEWLFDNFMTLEYQIDIWNSVQKDCGTEHEIFYKTSECEDFSNEKLGELGLLQEIMYPYYQIKKDGEQSFYNELQVSNWITNDVWVWVYDVLSYIFNENLIILKD